MQITECRDQIRVDAALVIEPGGTLQRALAGVNVPTQHFVDRNRVAGAPRQRPCSRRIGKEFGVVEVAARDATLYFAPESTRVASPRLERLHYLLIMPPACALIDNCSSAAL